MKKRIIGAVLLAAALGAAPALAGPRTDTTKKGSLLIFPNITIDSENSPGPTSTLIEISNDNTKDVWIKCFYVNERKGRVDFSFHLTSKATASWDVLTLDSENARPARFPSNGDFPGNARRGELICFAVNAGLDSQIAFNHLTGTATVVFFEDDDARQTRQAYRYNAFAFMARGDGGPPPDGTIQGTPGRLELSGLFAGTYDACPVYNIANFMPNGATLDGVHTIDNDLVVVSCKQDLRQAFDLHTTKLVFKIWDADEHDLTGAYRCVDSVDHVGLSSADGNNPVNVSSFDFDVVGTRNARFEVQGFGDSRICTSPYINQENTGVLGVLTSSIRIGPSSNGDDEDQELGSTLFAAGYDRTGFVLWDPHGPPLATPK